LNQFAPEVSAARNQATAKTKEKKPSQQNAAAGQENFIKKYLGDLYDDMEQFSINEEFENAFDAWDGKDTNTVFTVGRTSDALKSIGMRDQEIILRSGTVTQKLKKHPEMTRDIFKKIPYLLENPVIVQFSDAIDPKTGKPKFDSRITVLGELYATMETDGVKEEKPVLVSMELLPTNRSGNAILDFSVITSAYAKEALQTYLSENSILYIDPDKKRTKSWLSLNRLQLPLGENKLGSVRSITYSGGKVKIENSKNKNSMQAALERAGAVDSYGNSIWQDEQNDAQVEAEEVFSLAEDSIVDQKLKYREAETNHDVLKLVNDVKQGTYKPNQKVYFKNVPEEIAEAIYRLTGKNVRGFKVAIEARQINHILKDHGANGRTDHSMKDDEAIARMEYALNHPDTMRLAGKTQAYSYMQDGKNRTAETVLYEKGIGNKSYYVVQAIADTKAKTLYIVSAFIGKKEYKKGTSQLIDAKSPDVTAKSGSVVVPKNSISDSDPKSNTFSEISSDEIHSYADDAVIARDPSDILRGIISQLVDPAAKKNDPNASEKDVLKQYGKYHQSLKIYQEMQRTVERNQARIEQYDSDVVKLLRSNDYVRSINQKRKRLAEINEDLHGNHLSQTERNALEASKKRIEKSIQQLEKDLAELKLITENYGGFASKTQAVRRTVTKNKTNNFFIFVFVLLSGDSQLFSPCGKPQGVGHTILRLLASIPLPKQ